ncbi:hypothetical protein SEA_BEUFFERT_5 [Streptomyces phage Beuffert]|nr:hypothetical protein SEA_BEUFFERT_5 [Streptomyces phage Beuffert]
MAAKQKDLQKCKTKAAVKAFAAKHNLAIRESGNEIQVAGWTCVFTGDRFDYIK